MDPGLRRDGGGALLLASAGQASARDRMDWLKEQLNLSDTQVTTIREMYAGDGPTQRQIFQSLRQAQRDLRQMALNGADETLIQQKTAEISGIMAQGLRASRAAPAEDGHDPEP